MYFIAMLAAAVYLVLGVVSRREKAMLGESRFLKPVYRRAAWLYKRICPRRNTFFQSSQVKKDLERLHPGENTDVLEAEYYVKKTGLVILILMLGTVLGTAAKFQADAGGRLDLQGMVSREKAGGGVRQLALEARIGRSFTGCFQIDILPRQLSREEADGLEKEFWERLCQVVPGPNESLEKVSASLELAEELSGFPFQVNWRSAHPDLVGTDGSVHQIESGRVNASELNDPDENKVILTAQVEYGDWEWIHDLTVCIVPPSRTEQEEIGREVEQLLRLAQESEPTQEQWQLPQEWDGQKISWSQQTEDNSLLFWGIIAAAALCIYFFKDKDLHEQTQQRGRQMASDYPMIVNKMALYLGAGMTVRGSYQKIAGDYQQARKKGGKKLPAYEELVYTCRELQTGIAEGAAYERFGKRTGIQEYVRFSALLTQNLKKGNSTLVQRLREEAAKAAQEERNRQKKFGEEASTKLLVPMVMMLAIVMVLVMIPAFSSMGV